MSCHLNRVLSGTQSEPALSIASGIIYPVIVEKKKIKMCHVSRTLTLLPHMHSEVLSQTPPIFSV